MLLGEILRVALQSIRANLIRSCLTMLGIIIGVAAVITMLAAGSGAQQQIEEQIEALGANVLNITAETWFLRGVARDQLTLAVEDIWALREHAQYLDAIVPTLEDRGQVNYGGRNMNARLIGTTADFVDLFNYTVQHGRMFTDAEDQSRQRVAVVGASIPQFLDVENPPDLLGERVLVRGVPFIVVGILEEIGGVGSWSNPDQQVMLPVQTAESRVFGAEDLEDISVRVVPDVSLQTAMVDVERVLRAEHKIPPGFPNDFAIYDRKQFLETREQAQQTFTMLLASIAGVSLLVGGIGIMNIMLVSVTERTREIGVRMALGATRLNIMTQFLIEAIALCLLGGALGVAAGAGMALLLSRTAGWAVYVSPESVMLAVAFSLAVGLFFGLLPARRAAALDPIEALRYE